MQQCTENEGLEFKDKIVYWNQKIERLNKQVEQLPVSLNKAVKNYNKFKREGELNKTHANTAERRRFN